MIPPKNQGEKIDKVIFEDIKNFYYGTKTLDDKISESDGEFYGSLIGSSFGVITATYTIDNLPKVLNSTLKGGNISSISKISYKTENTSLALYDKSKTVATNGTLVPPLTTNRALATVPLLTDGANKIIRKTDFYVRPDGSSSTLPATAYRYLDSKAYVETKKNMTGNLSYFGFKKFDAAYQARDAFQIKYDYYNQNDSELSWSDAAVRGTFDTLQLHDNTTGKLKVRIPYTFGDTGKNLEPFTEFYPEYGQGGELQMIRLRWDEDLIIKYDRLDILPNPRTDLILKEEIIK